MSDLPAKKKPDENNPPSGPSPAILERFLENQTRELDLRVRDQDLRREELELRRQESKQAHDYANRTLDAQVEFLKGSGQQEKRDSRYMFIILFMLVITIGGFTAYALYLNKEQFVLDVIKVLAGVAGGGGVGYAIGRSRQAKQEKLKPEE